MDQETTDSSKMRLFTPGPLNTPAAVRLAMMRDWGSRTPEFVELTRRVRDGLRRVSNATSEFEAVPLQGSGTFAVEATLATIVPASGKVLIMSNGAYGDRLAAICAAHGVPHTVCRVADASPLDWDAAARFLEAGDYSHMALVHCETSTGFLNSVDEALSIAGKHAVGVIVDAMSTFAALPIDYGAESLQAVVASANKCLHGVPGVAFVLARRRALECARAARSLALDLRAQWLEFERSGQWRFTPPTQAVAALDAAIRVYEELGGQLPRWRLYQSRCDRIVAELSALGFRPLLRPEYQAPVIVAFQWPLGRALSYDGFYRALALRHISVYPLTCSQFSGFRVGCMGELEPADIDDLVHAVAQVVNADFLGSAPRDRRGAERDGPRLEGLVVPSTEAGS